MLWITIAFLGPLVALGIYASFRGRILTISMFLAALFVWFFGMSDQLGRPKDVWMEWKFRHVEEATVLGSQIREGVGIYIWVALPGVAEPMSFKLPWNKQMAQELQQEARKAQEGETGLMIKLPFERSYDPQEKKFYSMPQPKIPDKPPGQAPVQVPRPVVEA